MSTNRQMAEKCLEGVSGDDDLSTGLLREATVRALLDVADAIREQTARIEVLVTEDHA